MTDINRIKPYDGPVRAVVMDWAGTAVDYGCMGPVTPFVEVFRTRGVSVTVEEARGPMGLEKKDHIRAMCEMESVSSRWLDVLGRLPMERDVEDMYAEVEPLMVEAVARHSDPIPGLLEAVSAFRGQGIRIGSTSGYPGSVMEALVSRTRDKGYDPDSVVCATQVPAGRPHPWMCYRTAVNLRVFPFASMVKIGDTVSDIQEGLNAGMWTIGITQTGNELGLSADECSATDPEVLRAKVALIEGRFLKAGAHFVAAGIWECPGIIEEIGSRLSRGERP